VVPPCAGRRDRGALDDARTAEALLRGEGPRHAPTIGRLPRARHVAQQTRFWPYMVVPPCAGRRDRRVEGLRRRHGRRHLRCGRCGRDR
jgi:hypothetical protein